jgi:hypothetical protein
MTPVPESYAQFRDMAMKLVEPLVALMKPGCSTLPIIGMASDHDENADRFEAYARPALLAALWLQTEPADGETVDRQRVAKWFREGLLLGTNPKHPQYWGQPTNFHQIPVEMAILVMALDIARESLWTPLSRGEKAQVADWLAYIRGNASPWNNHLFFDVLVLEFLMAEGFGEPGDRYAADFLLHQLESMYQGDGWFIDGTNETFDYYNAFAFHTYGLWWAWRHGNVNPVRAAWWKERAALFLRSFPKLFAADGGYVPFGRSIIYRFNALGAFGMAELCGLDAISPGMARRLCRMNLGYFLSRSITQEQGCLSVGFTSEFPPIAEPYSCAGSPYWAAKGLLMLLLPPTHRFWSAPEQPIPSEQGDSVTVIPATASVIRHIGGRVEYLNGGGRCSPSAADRFGAEKWGRIAYRSGFGYLVQESKTLYPRDAALTATDPADPSRRYGRHAGIVTEANDQCVSYAYGIGEKKVRFHVKARTLVFWNAGWLLTVHHLRVNAPAIIDLGSFAIPMTDPDDLQAEGFPPHATVRAGGLASAVQGLFGFHKTTIDARLDASEPRRHLLAEYHACPILRTHLTPGTHTIAGLLWGGESSDEKQPWELIAAGRGEWQLDHPALGTWVVKHESLPAFAPLNAP